MTITPPRGTGLSLVASVPLAGFAKQNGTPTIWTYQVPNDGQLHRFLLLFSEDVTTGPETGGQMTISYTTPDGHAGSTTFLAGQAAGQHQTSINLQVQAGTTIVLSQSTALTVGATTLWADLYFQ